MLTSADAARIFHDWAFKEGLLAEPAAKPSNNQAQQGAIDPITDAGIHVLRSKQIQSIGFNQAKEEVQIFLKRAAPTSRKQLKALPAKIDNIQVVYRQGVQNPIGSAPSVPFGQPPFTMRQSATGKHLTCGSSISVGNNREAGTLGCLVKDADGNMFGLSNNHITGSCSFAQINLPIVAPGVFDVAPGGLNPFTIGFHTRALKLVAGAPGNVNHKDNLDAAIFKIANEADVSSFQGSAYDTPTQSASLAGGLEVEKVGRTTGHTKGKVVSQIFGAHGINYNAALYGFSGVVYYEPVFAVVGITDAFSTNGDSGSLVTTVDQNGVRSAVGLIVGGMNDGSSPGKVTSIILPIEPILKMLAVTLVSGHNI
jgi:hypothetical protein